MVKPEKPSAHDRSSDAKYKGVRKRKWGKWVSEIRLPNSRERIWLGSYDTPEKAARAFDAALYCLRGSTAKFNFRDQIPDIPGGTSLPPSEIQAAAARFANSISNSNCTTTEDNNSSSSSSSEDSPSPSISDGAFQTDHGEGWTSQSPQLDPTSPFLNDFSYMNLDHNDIGNSTNYNNTGVPDFGIYPGFDDYFMTTTPPPSDYVYGEDNSDGIYLQGSSFLWNF
ncbi:unnamed protein product [Lactuca virosa]|uniref:AP2/ERF domain-containing protein n=1 Tax=Lactuca virosa TaxID=75947 RepID=A0AAU9MTL4_9ASTR|nr:unnamed protein product [Lactuca virosa]